MYHPIPWRNIITINDPYLWHNDKCGQLTIAWHFIVRKLIRKQCGFSTCAMNVQKRYVIVERRIKELNDS